MTKKTFMVLDINDPDFLKAAQKLYCNTDDERVRSLCEGLIEGERTVRSLQLEIQMQKEEMRQKDNASREALRKKDEENARLRAEINALKQQK